MKKNNIPILIVCLVVAAIINFTTSKINATGTKPGITTNTPLATLNSHSVSSLHRHAKILIDLKQKVGGYDAKWCGSGIALTLAGTPVFVITCSDAFSDTTKYYVMLPPEPNSGLTDEDLIYGIDHIEATDIPKVIIAKISRTLDEAKIITRMDLDKNEHLKGRLQFGTLKMPLHVKSMANGRQFDIRNALLNTNMPELVHFVLDYPAELVEIGTAFYSSTERMFIMTGIGQPTSDSQTKFGLTNSVGTYATLIPISAEWLGRGGK